MRQTGEWKQCAICQIPVYIPRSRLGKDNYFCTLAHANEWQGRNKTTHICKTCGEPFKWSPSRTSSGKYNITYCSLACRNADPARAEMLLEMNRKQQAGKRTNAEVLGYGVLDELGLDYLPQHLIADKFCVDAYVPRAKLVVQFDGDYWHGNPTTYSTLDARQAKRVRLDKSQDAYLEKCGYRVLRLWHSRLKTDAEGVKNDILRLVNRAA